MNSKCHKTGKTVTKMELLHFNRLCHIVGVPQRTAGNWLEEFTIYIPKKQQQDGIYYLPEAIDILRFIKKCKYQNYEKSEIMKQLAKKSFPIRVENTMEDVHKTVEQGEYRDNILTVMQTIGKTVSNVATQNETIQTIQEQQTKQKKRIKIIEEQAAEIAQLKQEIEALKQQFSTAKAYEVKKYTLAKLFE